MKKGERSLYRSLASAALAVAESRNYAEEYMAKVKLVNADRALREWAHDQATRLSESGRSA